ncbi:MAG TPA: hypothetical protein VGV35_03210, partial [Bryobacteraceae bacterium]|nr:hypothetical protein [Bryobacteraceae bacterium]
HSSLSNGAAFASPARVDSWRAELTTSFRHALPQKAQYEIRYPRVEGYTQATRNRVTIPDWEKVPRRPLLPDSIPPEVEMKALNISAGGRG